MTTRIPVRFSTEFLDAARRRYPAARGMDYSGPTYGEFMAAPVKAAIEAFGDDWDNQPAEAGGSVRSIITRPSGPFSPIVFIAALVTGPGGPHVLIDSFEDDPDYYNQFFLDDPEA